MKARIFFYLLISTFVHADNTEWHVFVPSEGVNLDGIYGDHNQAIIQGNSFSEFDFDSYTSFVIPDQTGISAFSLEPVGESFIVWMSFSTPIDIFLPGDVLRCDAGDCQIVFRAQDELGIADTVAIDALDISDALISLSFDTGFLYAGEYIEPNNIYALGSNGIGDLLLVEQTNGVDLGLSAVANMTAYDHSPDGNGYSTFFGADTVFNRLNGTVFSHEILRVNSSDPSGSFALGFSEEFQTMSAFYSLNSGHVGLLGENIDVNENAGNLEVELYRTGGNESFVQVRVESIEGTAVEAVDFQFTPTTAEWINGDDSNKIINVDIIDNQQSDGIRTFYLQLTAYNTFTSIFSTHEVIEIRIIDDEIADLIFADGFE